MLPPTLFEAFHLQSRGVSVATMSIFKKNENHTGKVSTKKSKSPKRNTLSKSFFTSASTLASSIIVGQVLQHVIYLGFTNKPRSQSMKLSGILLLAAAQPVYPWWLRWGPLQPDGTPTYSRQNWWNYQTCQDFRNGGSKEPAPGWLWWQPKTLDNNGCCLHLYGSSTGGGAINHYCRRLDGGERHVICEQAPAKIYLKANEGIGSYRIMGCRGKDGKEAPVH
jgi:hypothetical protein